MIYFYGGEKATTLLELLKLGFSAEGGDFFVETYTDNKYENWQAKEGARRSFSDLLEIARTYFPDTTEKQLMMAMKEMGCYAMFCSDINKISFRRDKDIGEAQWHTYCYGMLTEDKIKQQEVYEAKEGIDGWSINSLKQLLET